MKDVSHPKRSSRNRRNRQRHHPLLGERAIATAREALSELDDGPIGGHLGVAGVCKNVATHRFAADVPGYSGWEWNAVLACATGSDYVTVNEVALVPTPEGDALTAPDWVPYTDRLRPGDLGPGDLMPPAPDDERLVEDAEDARAVVVDKRRKHHLTRAGLEQATTRWRTGDFGPNSEFAEKAALRCRTCAFYLPLGEPVGENFGVCANEYSADGTVVHATYGCGAHADTVVDEDNDERAAAFDDERPIF
ncbi:DUF3027 domain-containing protein [Corynebacterium yudongzhengii]|uniref:DUF3027 domain-containing protein n=1 Tax=Corynebacterium yudongzhengii TaxID=2080740 RepID=A0A2U1T7T1_9CORY|nr:DUF3027 domain-containing protein [Corynebacterium yudongzhengii]AWB82356.1 DUF3027 domain-containing protein [Corynebacterium yudongzhengii]PWC02025.1 DUF3027 domain-containing protein [Corynebacterium yudongzhengii]